MGSVNLTPAPEPTGDYNGNGVVDAADYTTWRDTLGQSVAMDGDGADGDESGEIDAGDYTYWVERFGNVVPEGGASAHFAPGESPGAISAIVPEPATLALLLIASAGLVVNGARSRFARGGRNSRRGSPSYHRIRSKPNEPVFSDPRVYRIGGR
jgi:hypothetical protein